MNHGLTMQMSVSAPNTDAMQLVHCESIMSSAKSICSVSDVKRLRIRPDGVVSKKSIGADVTACASCV